MYMSQSSYYILYHINIMDNILIKSIDRQTGTSSNFTTYSTLIIQGTYLLKYVIIPNTLYQVNEANRRFILEEGLNTYDITLSLGNYDFNSFSTMIANVLTTAGTLTYNVSIDAVTYQLNIFSTGAFRLNLSSGARVRSLLGFNQILPTADGSFNLVSENVVNLGSPTSLGIIINQSSTRGFENTATDTVGTLYIPLNVESGNYIALSSLDLPQYISFKSRERQLNISVIDTSTNMEVNLYGGEYELFMTRIK
jgi:hypothetical protein